MTSGKTKLMKSQTETMRTIIQKTSHLLKKRRRSKRSRLKLAQRFTRTRGIRETTGNFQFSPSDTSRDRIKIRR